MKTVKSLLASFFIFTTSFSLADSYLWVGNSRQNVNALSTWYNETTGATATVLPSAFDTVKMDFEKSTVEKGAPYAYQIITFLQSDISWGDTLFKNINANKAGNDVLDKFISQGTGRNITLKSLTYENAENKNYLWFGGGDSATPANISVTNSVKMGTASDSATMNGVLVFGGNSNVGAGSSGGAIGPCQKVSIGGDITLYGNSTFGFNTNFSGTSADPSVSVGGVIKMNSLNEISPTLWLTNRTYDSSTSGVNTYVKARGLDGSGKVRNNLSAGFRNFNTTLEISTQSGDNFIFDGTLNNDSELSNKLNIVKSGEGKQTFILRNSDTVLSGSSVEVKGGNFELYNLNSTIASLNLATGKFGAASANDDIAGTAKFATGTFAGGEVVVDIFSETLCDVIDFSNSLNILAVTKVEIGTSHFTGNEGTYTYSIIKTPTLNGILEEDIDNYFIAVDSNGNAISGASFSYNDSKINLTMNVPEPSTYAVILGAFVLGFAAWRKRK